MSEIIRLDEVGSTNDYAKEKRREGKNMTVIAKRQTSGRGTRGRSFSSESGGAYLSKLTFYENFPAKRAFAIMTGAAVAVCETLKGYGFDPKIKWPNDIYLGDKKVCGILIENTFSGAQVSSSVVGVGLNVCNPLPEELKEIATSLTLASGKEYSVDEVTERLISALDGEYSMEEYRRYLGYTGEKITLLLGEVRASAILLCVEEDGGLTVEIEGEKRTYSSAEVRLKI